jgi:cytochrome oxidase assembly protein ShyY1
VVAVASVAVYRFLATPRWLGFTALMLALAGVMVGLGFWQHDRYETRHAINTRIDQANATAPVPIADVLRLGTRLPSDREWTRVKATGHYDTSNVVVARGRTVNDRIGFEILVPLVLPDGSRLIVDRGWIPNGSTGAAEAPRMPPLPTGTVSVEGRVHLPESEADRPVRLGSLESVRRIAPATLNKPQTYAEYLLLDKQTPATPGFTRIPADRQPSWMNAGYTVQWWAFSLLALFGLVWAVRREASDRRLGISRDDRRSARSSQPRRERPRDRLGEDDDQAPAPIPAAREPGHAD